MKTNVLHLGDNLVIMKSLPDESVDLIYCDPPFNTGKDWGEFDDRWDDLSGYLNFMMIRIKEVYRLLKSTGSFYLHCDPTTSHYLKVEVDKIFSRKHFRNEIIWCYTKPVVPCIKQFPNATDTILFYSKSSDWCFNKDDVRIPYKNNDVGGHLKKIKTGESLQEWKDRKISEGKIPENWWVNISPIHRLKTEKVGYPTQKPIALLDRIIQVSSDVGDIILDPFCGSGTALVSANQLGRYYIGIDENPKAISISSDRLQQQNLFTMKGQ